MATNRSRSTTENREALYRTEPVFQPMIPSAAYRIDMEPTIHLDSALVNGIELKSASIADTWSGTTGDHTLGNLGDAAFRKYARKKIDFAVLDGGDGGVDVRLNGTTIQIKTVERRHSQSPELWADDYTSYSADYYVLVSRDGPRSFRLVGYAPQQLVRCAPTRTHDGGVYRVLDREYLFPFPRAEPVNL